MLHNIQNITDLTDFLNTLSYNNFKRRNKKLQILTNNTFTFNDEDNVASFNKKEILFTSYMT